MALDVKSVFGTHLVRRVIDASTVELMCGRIGTHAEGTWQPSRPSNEPVCDGCRAATRFELGH